MAVLLIVYTHFIGPLSRINIVPTTYMYVRRDQGWIQFLFNNNIRAVIAKCVLFTGIVIVAIYVYILASLIKNLILLFDSLNQQFSESAQTIWKKTEWLLKKSLYNK